MNKSNAEAIYCPKGQMKRAWYGEGEDVPAPISPDGQRNDFFILVDSNSFASDFISYYEGYLRRRAESLSDAEYSILIDDWDKMTPDQKRESLNEKKRLKIQEADSVHAANNRNHHQVWIINNSPDTVAVQMQDASFICILQALNEAGEWAPIQYWSFSDCGNSYYFKYFLPGIANSFITKLPTLGEFKTKLRYKLLGADRFYYSNEFNGRIDYCELVEDSGNYNRRRGGTVPHFKLDSLIHVAWDQYKLPY